MNLDEKIKMLRKQSGLSQEELAQKLNVSRQAVSKWEMGVIPDMENLVKIADFFNCTLDFLMIDDITYESANRYISSQPIKEEKKSFFTTDRLIKLMQILPIIGFFILWILSKIVDMPIDFKFRDPVKGYYYIGFTRFILEYDLEGIVILLFAIWIVGLICDVAYTLYFKPQKTSTRLQGQYLKLYLAKMALLVIGSLVALYLYKNPWYFYMISGLVIILIAYLSGLVLVTLALNKHKKDI